MFGWRKRRDGFEWREYVRTTILVRREKRRQRVEELREVAVDNLKEAGRKGVDMGAAGLEVAGAQVKKGFRAAAASSADAVAGLAQRLKPAASAMSPAGRGLGNLGSGARGLARRIGDAATLARLDNPIVQIMLLIGAIVGGTALSGQWSRPRGLETASLADARGAAAKPAAAAGPVSGSAVARSGDVLRIGNTSVKLAGIEAPERNQPCTRANGKQWDCGQAAMQALSGQVRGKKVTCELSGREADGIPVGTCKVGDDDVAAVLAAGGYVFSDTGLFAAYSGQEAKAREMQAGIWQGESERPADYRAKRWDEARKAAPDGCPIKAQISGGNRHYVLPWAPSYEKVKIRTARGERWFCSEADAQAAGWKLAER